MSWEDNQEPEVEAMKIIDEFTKSDVYHDICKHAEDGDIDSNEVLEELSTHMGSICFHLQNESGEARIRYELAGLKEFADKWKE
jgi:hypothetical protein